MSVNADSSVIKYYESITVANPLNIIIPTDADLNIPTDPAGNPIDTYLWYLGNDGIYHTIRKLIQSNLNNTTLDIFGILGEVQGTNVDGLYAIQTAAEIAIGAIISVAIGTDLTIEQTYTPPTPNSIANANVVARALDRIITFVQSIFNNFVQKAVGIKGIFTIDKPTTDTLLKAVVADNGDVNIQSISGVDDPAVAEGFKGTQGVQGIFRVNLYQVVTHVEGVPSVAPSKPEAASYMFSDGTFQLVPDVAAWVPMFTTLTAEEQKTMDIWTLFWDVDPSGEEPFTIDDPSKLSLSIFQGFDAVSGQSARVDFAYATSADGTANFNTTPRTDSTYIGVQSVTWIPPATTPTQSTTASDYTWSQVGIKSGAALQGVLYQAIGSAVNISDTGSSVTPKWIKTSGSGGANFVKYTYAGTGIDTVSKNDYFLFEVLLDLTGSEFVTNILTSNISTDSTDPTAVEMGSFTSINSEWIVGILLYFSDNTINYTVTITHTGSTTATAGVLEDSTATNTITFSALKANSIGSGTTLPTTGVDGELFINSSNDELYRWTGSNWRLLAQQIRVGDTLPTPVPPGAHFFYNTITKVLYYSDGTIITPVNPYVRFVATLPDILDPDTVTYVNEIVINTTTNAIYRLDGGAWVQIGGTSGGITDPLKYIETAKDTTFAATGSGTAKLYQYVDTPNDFGFVSGTNINYYPSTYVTTTLRDKMRVIVLNTYTGSAPSVLEVDGVDYALTAGTVGALSTTYDTAVFTSNQLSDTSLTRKIRIKLADGTYRPTLTVIVGGVSPFTPALSTKLGAIEDSATADQTGAEIVTSLDAALGNTTWQSGGGGTALVKATSTEAKAGTNDTKYVTPLTAEALVDASAGHLDVKAGASITSGQVVCIVGDGREPFTVIHWNAEAIAATNPLGFATFTAASASSTVVKQGVLHGETDHQFTIAGITSATIGSTIYISTSGSGSGATYSIGLTEPPTINEKNRAIGYITEEVSVQTDSVTVNAIIDFSGVVNEIPYPKTFQALTDTPANFTAQADKSLKVNSGATALEFTPTNKIEPIVDSGVDVYRAIAGGIFQTAHQGSATLVASRFSIVNSSTFTIVGSTGINIAVSSDTTNATYQTYQYLVDLKTKYDAGTSPYIGVIEFISGSKRFELHVTDFESGTNPLISGTINTFLLNGTFQNQVGSEPTGSDSWTLSFYLKLSVSTGAIIHAVKDDLNTSIANDIINVEADSFYSAIEYPYENTLITTDSSQRISQILDRTLSGNPATFAALTGSPTDANKPTLQTTRANFLNGKFPYFLFNGDGSVSGKGTQRLASTINLNASIVIINMLYRIRQNTQTGAGSNRIINGLFGQDNGGWDKFITMLKALVASGTLTAVPAGALISGVAASSQNTAGTAAEGLSVYLPPNKTNATPASLNAVNLLTVGWIGTGTDASYVWCNGQKLGNFTASGSTGSDIMTFGDLNPDGNNGLIGDIFDFQVFKKSLTDEQILRIHKRYQDLIGTSPTNTDANLRWNTVVI